MRTRYRPDIIALGQVTVFVCVIAVWVVGWRDRAIVQRLSPQRCLFVAVDQREFFFFFLVKGRREWQGRQGQPIKWFGLFCESTATSAAAAAPLFSTSEGSSCCCPTLSLFILCCFLSLCAFASSVSPLVCLFFSFYFFGSLSILVGRER